MGNIASSIVSEQELRAAAVKELGLEDVSREVQDEIIAVVRKTIFEQINIDVMKALGPNGIAALGDVNEETSAAFEKKLVELLPNIGEIIKGAIEEAVRNQRAAIEETRRRFSV
jgi:hypothetical protein